MRHSKIAGGVLCIGVLIAAGCSSNKPSKADLTSAIDGYYAANPECVFPNPVQLPAKIDNSNQQEMVRYNALTAAGLLTKEEAKAKAPAKPTRHARRSRHAAKAPAAPATTTFELSDNGRFSWTEDQSQPGFGNFCYGSRHVTSIDSMATSRKNGTMMAVASYHYDLTGVAPWAKSSDIQPAFPKVQQALSGQQVAKANLVKGPTGWKLQPEAGQNGETGGTADSAPGSAPSSAPGSENQQGSTSSSY